MTRLQPSVERRAHRRLPVTLAARMLHGPRSHRTAILDLSSGGLLLAPADGLRPRVGDTMEIEAVLVGRMSVEVVALSPLGIHVRIQDASADYHVSVRRLSALAATWQGAAPEPGARGGTAGEPT